MKNLLVKLPIVLLFAGNSYATNYYVSNSGNNSNSGLSQPQAWATLQYAANEVAPGDCVLVVNGTYTGCYISTNGNSGNPIVFKALGNSATINQPNGTTNDGINIEGADWIVIEGFRVINQPRTGIRVVNATNCIIRKNYCDNNQRWGILTGFADNIIIEYNECLNSQIEHGIYFSNSADNPIIRYNKSHHNYACGIHMNGDISLGGDGLITGALVEGNTIYENGAGGGSGINCDGVASSIIRNNLLYENHSSGISLYAIDGASGSVNNKVYNNTVINASNARWCVNITDNSTGNTLYNNILINKHPSRGSITIETASRTGFVSNSNILINRLSNDGDNTVITLSAWQASGYDSNSLLAAAQASIFVNPVTYDFHLLSTSQARDNGSAAVSPNVPLDLDKSTRPQGSSYDIGCYEFLIVNSNSEIAAFANSISVYPNPFSTETVLEIRDLGMGIKDLKMQIYDAFGKMVLQSQILNRKSLIKRSDLPNGIYFLKVISENQSATKKIIIH